MKIEEDDLEVEDVLFNVDEDEANVVKQFQNANLLEDEQRYNNQNKRQKFQIKIDEYNKICNALIYYFKKEKQDTNNEECNPFIVVSIKQSDIVHRYIEDMLQFIDSVDDAT